MSLSFSERRDFLRRSLSRVLHHAAESVTGRLAPAVHVRPPGALPEPAFLAACTRCGDCGRACPAGAIVFLETQPGVARGTPVLDAARAPCLMCPDMPCVAACPTNALVAPADGWLSLRMGEAVIDTDRCIAHRGVTCGVCARVCPIGARALTIDAEGRPLVGSACTGCGACVTACVTAPSSITIRVAGEVA